MDSSPQCFGYSTPEVGPLPNRDTLKWLQSLDLPVALRHPRRDAANGRLVAGIFLKYFPEDVLLTAFPNGTSAKCKQENWKMLQRIAAKRDIFFEDDIVRKITQGEPGAATALLEGLHQQLGSRSVVHEGEAGPGHAGGADPSKPLAHASTLTRRSSVSIGLTGLKEISKAAASALAKQAAGPTKPGLALDLPDDLGPSHTGLTARQTPRLGRRASLLNGRAGFGQQVAVSEEELDANPLGGLLPIPPVAGHEKGFELGPVTITHLDNLDAVIAWRQKVNAM
ncbi:hypothetical protein WJX74_004611 [Apatococcus lobatus]